MSSNLPSSSPPKHLLLFEPRVEGHHLTWLRMVLQDFRSTGCRLTVALDDQPQARQRWQEFLAEELPFATVLPIQSVCPEFQRDMTAAVAAALKQSQADEVFMGSMDEIGSKLLRKTALGLWPPKELHGR